MLKCLDHFLGSFTAKTTLRISAPRETSDRILGGKQDKLLYIMEFYAILGAFTVKTTLRISGRLKLSCLFTMGFYSGNDRPQIF